MFFMADGGCITHAAVLVRHHGMAGAESCWDHRAMQERLRFTINLLFAALCSACGSCPRLQARPNKADAAGPIVARVCVHLIACQMVARTQLEARTGEMRGCGSMAPSAASGSVKPCAGY